MKKVLLITYYWPPSGGSGVQRWLNFTKYLPDFDIEPVVYTVSNPNYAIEDLSLQSPNIKVIKQPIWEPYQMASVFSGKNMKATSSGFLDESKSVKTKMVNYIRANFFIPDARKYWIKPSVKYLKNYISENQIDTIITSGPPHSLHLIGLQLQTQLGVKWIADFRDPWTQIDYFHKLPFSKKALQKHFDLEKKVAEQAHAILVVVKSMRDYFLNFNQKVSVISNGFKTEKDSDTPQKLEEKFTLTHIGLLNVDRNSEMFWSAISELIQDYPDFKKDVQIKLIGKVATEVRQSIQKFQLEDVVKFIDYVPHDEVMRYQKSTQVLLLFVNRVPSAKGIITGKIFEYLLAKRPILAIGPTDGDLADVIQKTESGVVVDFDDKAKLKASILNYFEAYKTNTLRSDSKHINDFHAKTICSKLAEIIKT